MTLPEIGSPQAGTYQMRLVKNGPWVGVLIEFAQPPDPENPAERLDRSLRWMAWVDGRPREVMDIWPWCCGRPISLAEYRFLLARADHAEKYEPDSPFADPRRAVDLMTVKPPTF